MQNIQKEVEEINLPENILGEQRWTENVAL